MTIEKKNNDYGKTDIDSLCFQLQHKESTFQ